MPFLSRSGRIALIELYGVIGRRVRPQDYVPLLERARKSGGIRALVLAIDSPGGSAPASEELYLAVAKVAAQKPVVAYIRGMGASGALYISVAAHKTIALRNALVGSIGVIFARLVAEQLFLKLGLSFSVQKAGAHKDMFSPWRQPTAEEDRKMEALTADVYDRFIQVVAEGRKLAPEAVRGLATGELFTAQKAKDAGLIDELGDLDAALDMAASMAGIKRRIVTLRPRRPRQFLIRPAFGAELSEALMDELESSLAGRLWL